ncbi:hypothetical protein [Alkalicoccobacillus plakortidis]|uniref:Lipoprotein n=1 Tax=Alkalicoccobacillus plakortidis TaxID=444060 RepID=A0ABT0XPS2_9BACI|nr:hypothetical protein [Alkalicoccobacillus plakortidis]MCM2677904.1 hypothetical protein [Alkalicoccobacillus plakortidis]
MKNLTYFLSLVSIVILTGCSDKAIFNNSACAEFEIDEFIFDEAVEDVDLIAHVKINEIVGIQKSEPPSCHIRSRFDRSY